MRKMIGIFFSHTDAQTKGLVEKVDTKQLRDENQMKIFVGIKKRAKKSSRVENVRLWTQLGSFSLFDAFLSRKIYRLLFFLLMFGFVFRFFFHSKPDCLLIRLPTRMQLKETKIVCKCVCMSLPETAKNTQTNKKTND